MTDLRRGTRSHAVADSPYGELTLVAEDDRLIGLYMDVQRHRPDDTRFGERAHPDEHPFDAVIGQLREYFRGERTDFDLPLDPQGTAFQRQVWAALCEIPYGRTWSYKELAEHIGRPTATRAVGLANGKNPIGIIVPCHRVIGSDGSLTGYGGGLDRKRSLLELEHALPAGPQESLFD